MEEEKKCPLTGRNHFYKGTGPCARAADGITRIRTHRCRCGATKVSTRKPCAAFMRGNTR